MSDKSKKTFWPYGILLSIIAVIIACVATIVVSLDYPVEMDNFNLEKYQKVDSDINEIMKNQKEFEKRFDVKILTKNIDLNKENKIDIKISKKLSNLENPKFEILLTRPDTNAHNVDLNATYSDEILTTKSFTPNLIGRWQIMLKLADKNSTGFYKFELFAR
ncbi:putative cytochrome c oxidase-associated protein CcoH [Campylobacter pinnipediorum subsp. caledonicus]|uniref:Putative cytochrome c oxidase-associated protein CcoH n=1 Tax=Campylobacter pinnipediorum subsp. caledonicus TaxID=1874362 RepID=A0A1S6U6B2_9BACT|nr:FixH family protein [Campylobacter pinnipediorum]AQW85623.1 putative cytochrome c oxidase-associated protein CcoH [Campylobacter pinnipediorum subsp. caledonicus]AQW87229.1 putative cytochrome c oxidase-associated protein CcoH [Campylobacter pinnipediorum subsp. caledonicus]